MEELIPIIIAVLYLIFKAFNKGSKSNEVEVDEIPTTESNRPRRNAGDILEEILLGEEFVQEQRIEPVSTAEPVRQVSSMNTEEAISSEIITDEESIWQRRLKEKSQELAQRRKQTNEKPNKEKTETVTKKIVNAHSVKKKFDLRNAVIYRAILDRPYE